MAQRKKSTKKVAPKKLNTKKKYKRSGLPYQTCALIFFAAAILTGIFTYMGSDAFVAVFFHDILFGLFAKTAWLIPVISAGLGVYVIKAKGTSEVKAKSIMLFFFAVCIAALIHTISDLSVPVSELYGYGIAGTGGGFFGGLLSAALVKTVGTAAAIVILVFAVIALMSLILKISVVTAVSSFISGFFAMREEIEPEKSDKYEQGRKAKKKIEKIIPEPAEASEPRLTGSQLDFEVDGEKKNKKEKKENPQKDVIPIEEIETVIFKPDPGEEITSSPKADNPAEENSSPEDDNRPATKEEKASPLTKKEKEQFHSELNEGMADEIKEYVFPPLKLLKAAPPQSADKRKEMRETAQKLMEVLGDFNVNAKLLQVTQGPSVTRYEIQPETGIKLSKITGLSEDIAWKLAVPTVLVAAVPGKAAVGIEVPNTSVSTVSAREILESDKFQKAESKLAVCFGKDIGGNVVVGDIAKMPHVLIAGATGSGKSVCINTIITSILYKAKPDEVKLIMVDPKVVELGVYNGIPHLLIPVVTDPKRAAGALNWAVQEMMKRYDMFAATHVRNLEGYNKHCEKTGDEKMPKIVIIIDELADLMMVAAKEVEDSICRLAQLARAAGIHLIVATQRPSVDVITGLIKANVPSRIAFAVSSQVDSRTILDRGGAEKLLGKGDMLYYPSGMNTPMRVQGAFVSDGEIESIVDFIKENSEVTHYSEDLQDHIDRCQTGDNGVTDDEQEDDADALLPQAIELACELGQISTAMVQRRLKVGYARAGRIIDQMEMRGIISGANGSKPREVLISKYSIGNNME